MRSKNSFKKSFIWVQSHPGSSERLEMRAIWSWLVTFEIYEMNWKIFLYHLSCYTLACLDMKKLTEQTLVAEKSSGATSAIHKNLFPQRIFGLRITYNYKETDIKSHIMLYDKAWQITFRSLINHYSDPWKQVLPWQEVR